MSNINNIFNISNIDNFIESKNDFTNEICKINELNIFSYSRIKKMKRKIYENKYDNMLDYLLNRNILKKQNRIKINNETYFFPDINNFDMLSEYDFKLSELKKILKLYKLRTSGNKEVLENRIYNYLYVCYNLINIQKNIRKFFVKKYIKIQGPARSNRSLCVNQRDFCTMTNIANIPLRQFFSIQDNNHVYGFDIMSIYNIFVHGNVPENPFTKNKFNNNVLPQILSFIKYSKLLNIKINTNFDNLQGSTEEDKLNLKTITIFHKINMLGNYANSSWFSTLNRNNLLLFIKELIDIWNYRANLQDTTKYNICPPNGNPFKNIVNSNINQERYISIKKISLNIIDNIIDKGINLESKKLGVLYVLSALTLVNTDAANAMPWLYQSVMHD